VAVVWTLLPVTCACLCLERRRADDFISALAKRRGVSALPRCAKPAYEEKMGKPTDPNQQAADDARDEALAVLATATAFDQLKDGVEAVYTRRRPRHGHEAAQILNFLEFHDPTKLVDVSVGDVRAALQRILRADPGDSRVMECLKLLP
jgi:hypothetical protein